MGETAGEPESPGLHILGSGYAVLRDMQNAWPLGA